MHGDDFCIKEPFSLNPFKSLADVNVWASLGRFVRQQIGPFFFLENVTKKNYLQMLQEKLLPILNEVRSILFQRFEAALHWNRPVKDWLDQNCPGRWIELSGLIPWAARTPDLTMLDYFL